MEEGRKGGSRPQNPGLWWSGLWWSGLWWSGACGTFVFASRDAFEVDHAQVQALLQPDAVHDADHLEGQHVLPQVLSHLAQVHQTIRGHSCCLRSGVTLRVWVRGHRYLIHDVDLFSQRVCVDQSQLQGNSVGVEEGAGLHTNRDGLRLNAGSSGCVYLGVELLETRVCVPRC